jgi:hypothetical protein
MIAIEKQVREQKDLERPHSSPVVQISPASAASAIHTRARRRTPKVSIGRMEKELQRS